MVGNMQVLPAKAPESIINVIFDFLSDLAQGETITTASSTASVWTGVDPNPSAVLTGNPLWNGTQVIQGLTGGLPGVIYKLLIAAATTSGQQLIRYAYLAIVKDPL